MFTGVGYFDVIAKGEEPSRMRVSTVRFAPAPARRGTPMRALRHCTSPTASGWSSPAAATWW